MKRWMIQLVLNQDEEMDDPAGATAESTRNWIKLQRDYPLVGYVHQKVSSEQSPKKKKAPRDTKTQTLLREWDRLKIIRGVLYRVVIYQEQERKKLVFTQGFYTASVKRNKMTTSAILVEIELQN